MRQASEGTRSRRFGSAGLSLVLLLAIASPARADNFGSNTASYQTPAAVCNTAASAQCIANNGLHTYYFSSVGSNQVSATNYACTSEYKPLADIDCSVRTQSTGADVYVYDSTYGSQYWAWTACYSTATYGGADPNKWCAPQAFRWDLSNVGGFDTPAERQYVSCHEFGHTLGLRHSGDSQSCMFPNVHTTDDITNHEAIELNSHYDIPD